MAAPVETKVKASTGASFAAGLALWILQKYVFKNEAVPDVLQSWIYAVAPAVITFGAGYWVHHTHRPDLPPGPVLVPVVPVTPPVTRNITPAQPVPVTEESGPASPPV
jgi:hypothetical protein